MNNTIQNLWVLYLNLNSFMERHCINLSISDSVTEQNNLEEIFSVMEQKNNLDEIYSVMEQNNLE